MAALGRELRHLQPLVQMGTRLEKYEQELAETRELIDSDDAEMAQEATAEAARLEASIETLLEEIKPALIPHDPLDDRPAIVEIRDIAVETVHRAQATARAALPRSA